jgi:hypothetical protein
MKTMREAVVPRWKRRREVHGRPDICSSAVVLGEELAVAAVLERKALALWEAARGRSL